MCVKLVAARAPQAVEGYRPEVSRRRRRWSTRAPRMPNTSVSSYLQSVVWWVTWLSLRTFNLTVQ